MQAVSNLKDCSPSPMEDDRFKVSSRVDELGASAARDRGPVDYPGLVLGAFGSG